MTAGRPTDYTPELLARAKAYAEKATDSALGESPKLASIAELALHLGVSRETLYAWAKEKQEFSDILQKVMTAQEMALLDNGLHGKWNPTITKLMLTKHGYTDKQDITSDGKALPTPILNGLSKDTDAE